uniref:(northern house mosquito) hypothetical protein n=1 Tax=Culex pipiens TaxID=7175 RepID=A0A8D8NA61_CULPI
MQVKLFFAEEQIPASGHLWNLLLIWSYKVASGARFRWCYADLPEDLPQVAQVLAIHYHRGAQILCPAGPVNRYGQVIFQRAQAGRAKIIQDDQVLLDPAAG